jgi:hypothetical protein
MKQNDHHYNASTKKNDGIEKIEDNHHYLPQCCKPDTKCCSNFFQLKALCTYPHFKHEVLKIAGTAEVQAPFLVFYLRLSIKRCKSESIMIHILST